MGNVRNGNPMSPAERQRRYRARQAGDNDERSYNRKRKSGPKPKAVPEPAPVDCRGYALDLMTPVRHVATELDKAGTRGATVVEMAETYRHPIPADFYRIRYWHGCVTNSEANRHIIDRAVRMLGEQLREARSGPRTGGRVRLAVPFGDLRYEGEPIHRRVGADAG